MLSGWKCTLIALAIIGLFSAGAATSTMIVAAQARTPGAQSTPRPQRLAAGEAEVKKLLLLMDKDKDGKISRQEFMAFMEAEFDRLDKNKNGELDAQELAQFQLRTKPSFTAVGK